MKIEMIKVMGKDIKVVYKPLEGLYGEYCADSRVISISDKLEGEELRRTLLHEIMHVLLSLSSLNEFLSDELEEALVRLAENHFIDIVEELPRSGMDNTLS